MGIIGRLDEQVDELIIKPLGERDRLESREPQASSKTTAPEPSTETQVDRTEGEEVSGARSSDLPVWLL